MSHYIVHEGGKAYIYETRPVERCPDCGVLALDDLNAHRPACPVNPRPGR